MYCALAFITVTNGGKPFLSFFHIIFEPDPFICPYTESKTSDQGSLDSLPVLPEFQRATKWTNVDRKVQLWRCILLMCFSATM